MGFKRSTLQIAAVLLGVLALIAFNLGTDRGMSPEQRVFQDWITVLESGRFKKELPRIEVVLQGSADEGKFQWRLVSNDRPHYERVMRILELLQEAKPARLQPVGVNDAPATTGDIFLISVSDSARRFVIPLTRDELARSIQLRNLIKLFELSQAYEH
jgi:hypothetical protein